MNGVYAGPVTEGNVDVTSYSPPSSRRCASAGSAPASIAVAIVSGRAPSATRMMTGIRGSTRDAHLDQLRNSRDHRETHQAPEQPGEEEDGEAQPHDPRDHRDHVERRKPETRARQHERATDVPVLADARARLFHACSEPALWQSVRRTSRPIQ